MCPATATARVMVKTDPPTHPHPNGRNHIPVPTQWCSLCHGGHCRGGAGSGWQWSRISHVWVLCAPLAWSQMQEGGSGRGHPAASHEKSIYEMKTYANRC